MVNSAENPKPVEQDALPIKEVKEDLMTGEQLAEDLITADVEARVADFENWQESQLARIDAEATQGESSALSTEELAEAKKETGLKAKLDSLIQKVKEIRDEYKEKAVDWKIDKVMQSPRVSKSFDFYYIKDLVASLTPEQISRHPELIEYGRKCLVSRFNKSEDTAGYFDVKNGASNEFETVLQAFEDAPEAVTKLLHDPEINEFQEKTFLACLYYPGSQHRALEYSGKLGMDPERTKSLAVQAIKQTVGNKSSDPNDNRRVYDVTDAIKDFKINLETRENLAFDNFKYIATGDYPWSLDGRWKSMFQFSDQEFIDFIEKNKETLTEFAYQGTIKCLRVNLNSGVVTSLFEHFKKYFNLDLSVEKFKQFPENAEVIKEVVYKSAANGQLLKDWENILKLSSVALEDILQSPEGKEALYQGIQVYIAQGEKGEGIEGFANSFKLDFDQVRSDPRTLGNIRIALQNNIERDGTWRPDLVDYFNINENEVSDLKVKAISSLLSLNNFKKAFALMDSLVLNEEQKSAISSDLFGAEDKFIYLEQVKQLMEKQLNYVVCSVFIKEHERFFKKTPQQLEAYFEISQKIIDSPSQEMIRIKDQLIEQILATDNPHKTYEVINNIFIQNNLPMMGKVERVFSALFPNGLIATKLGVASSPVLNQASARLRQNIFFQDLLKVHIESGNRSLKTFLSLLKEADPLTEKMGQNNLSAQEQKKLAYIFRKLKTVADTSMRGKQNDFPAVKGESLSEDYAEICSQLGVKPGQSVSERVVEMFARPLNYQNIDQILTEMSQSRQQAEARGRSAFASLNLQQGDLVKGVQIQYIDNILQNGSVAKEFLGAASDSDATPFDTDVEVLKSETKSDFKENFAGITLATSYGELMFVVKDRGQFQKTVRGEQTKYNKNKYELFQTGTQGENHFGVRTGFPCTEIDFMIYRGSDLKQQENLFYSIAQNGYYIPVVDEAGQTLFSPQLYDEYRKVFAGVARFDGQDMSFATSKGESYYPEINSIIKAKE
ncbi:MAG: hypothetical protein Q8P32_02900 [Candidatus Komeilibacteria bacterium]|nr:hypothetical protein [Candidatus Komeilibacteria bacterium]